MTECFHGDVTCVACKNGIRALESRAEKAEAALAAALEIMEKIRREIIYEAEEADPLALIDSFLKRAAGRESGGDSAATTKASGRTEPQMVAGKTDAAAKSAARCQICPPACPHDWTHACDCGAVHRQPPAAAKSAARKMTLRPFDARTEEERLEDALDGDAENQECGT